MSAHHIRHVDGQYQVYATDNGRRQTDLGPRWQTPRAAAQFVDQLDATATTTTPDSDRSTDKLDASRSTADDDRHDAR